MKIWNIQVFASCFAFGLCVGLCGADLTTAPASLPASAHYDTARAAVIRALQGNKEALETVTLLLADLEKQRSTLSGHTVWDKEKPSDASIKRLYDAVKRVTEMTGPGVAGALVLDAERSDYVRQAGIAALIEHKSYEFSDIEVLVEAFVAVPAKEPEVVSTEPLSLKPELWLRPEQIHARLARRLADLLGTSKPDDYKNSRLTIEKITKPKEWLLTNLMQAKTLDQNKKNADLIDQCIALMK